MMKTKIVPAYEKDSSVTIRVTPVDLGALVSKIPDGDLDTFFESLYLERIYMTKARRKHLFEKMKSCALKGLENE